MRFEALLLATAAGLAACASPAPNPEARDALSMDEGALLDATAEAEAVERERAFLAEMARAGVYPVEEPAQATVKYHQEDVTFGLYNEAYTAQSEFYSVPRASANYKVVDNIDMGALLKSLDDAGFFALAQNGIVRLPGASVSVVFRRGQDAWTLAWAPTMDKDRYDRTMECAKAVSALFNGTFGLQRVDNPEGVDYFEKERDRLREAAAERANKPGGAQ